MPYILISEWILYGSFEGQTICAQCLAFNYSSRRVAVCGTTNVDVPLLQ